MSAPTLKPVKCVVLPNHSPIDKALALKRVQLDFEGKFRIRLAFCDVNIPTPEHYQRWNAMCDPAVEPYFIDVGDKKYHANAPSAAAVEKMASPTHNARIYNFLVELVSSNNNAKVDLKTRPYSIVRLLRDIYKVANSQEVVLDHVMDVINGFFLRRNGRNWNDLFENPQFAELRALWEGFNVHENEVGPFTLTLYFRQLFLAGRKPNEISKEIGWWLRKKEQVDKVREAAEKKAYAVKRFMIGNKTAGVIEVDDHFEGQAAIRHWVGSGTLAVAIIRNRKTGHITIPTSSRHHGANFVALAETLNDLEPGRWYYETRFVAGPILMNGSAQYAGVTPTSLSDEVLIDMIYRLVIFAK